MIKVNKEKCIGCQLCVQIAPDNFEMDDNCKALLKSDMNPVKIKEAVNNCPVDAIE